MCIPGSARRFNPGRINRPCFIEQVHLLQRLPAVIIGRPVIRIRRNNRTEFADGLRQLAAIFEFIGKHVAQSAVARGLGQQILKSFNTVGHNYHVSVEVK